MSLEEQFGPVSRIKHAKTEDEFLAAIDSCHKNAYLKQLPTAGAHNPTKLQNVAAIYT